MKLGEAMYQASQAGQGGQGGPGGGEPGQGAGHGPKKDDVVDAEFQEVDDQDKKKRA